MKNKLAIVQNFVVTHEERLKTLHHVLPIQNKYFGEYNWYVNYNTPTFFNDVYKCFSKNIKNLTFYNDLTEDYGRIIQSMIFDIKEDYIFIFPPEDTTVINTMEYFDNLMDEFIKYDCEFMQMSRIDDIKFYGTDKKYFGNYDTKKFLHLVNSNKWTTQTVSSVSVYKKSFLNEILTYLNLNYENQVLERFPQKTPHSFENFFQRQNGRWMNTGLHSLLDDRLFAIPKMGMLRHYEPVVDNKIIKEVYH
tara:strand:+ start:740 stop:1486 length:747 start_codon:yes stop_codon:yes gene_type:complete